MNEKKGGKGKVWRFNELFQEYDLREGQSRFIHFFRVVERAGEAILLTDKKARKILYANPSFFELTGYAGLDELNCAGGVPALFADRKKAREIFQATCQGFYWQGEVDWVSKDGKTLPVLLRGGPVKSEAGECVGYLGICTDLRKHRELAREIAEREERLKQIINFVPDALLAIDTSGTVIAWNKAIEEMTGVPAQEMLGKGNYEYALPFYGVRRPLLVDLALARKVAAEVKDKYHHLNLKENGIVTAETQLARPGGKACYLWGKASCLYDTEGNVIGAVETIRDITEWKRAEEELKNAYRQLAAALDGTVRALSSAIEKRDPYTAGHQLRVSQIAAGIAEKLGLSAEQTEGIRTAALLHDIGKLYVPVEILTKPGRLNEYEFMLVKAHSQAGYDILLPIPFSQPVAETVLQHHERIDGSGYPRGLTGRDMLLEAKILAVADVVEAMSSHRPYRPAFSIEEACGEVKRNRGVLYDPEAVDACLAFLNQTSKRA